MKNKTDTGVIVIGGHVQGLGIIRIFGEKGIPVILLDNTSINIGKHSKYCKKFYKYHDLLKKLNELASTNLYKDWLIFPTHDEQVEIISKNRDFLQKHFNITTDKWENVKIFYNKKLSYPLAKEVGLDIPTTLYPKNEKDVLEANINLPCIIKPAVVEKFYKKAKKKVFICKTKEELLLNYKRAISIIPKDEIIIQEIIPGSSENQYSACFHYNSNEALVQLVAKRKRQHPIDFGNATTFAETVQDHTLIFQAEKILKKVRYNGLCEVEFKYDERDGKYKFLEVNPRTWKWHSISEKSNSPFLLSIYNLILFNKKDKTMLWENAAFKHIITDFPTIINLKRKKLYKKSEIKEIQYAVWNLTDIKPAIFELIYLIYFILKR